MSVAGVVADAPGLLADLFCPGHDELQDGGDVTQQLCASMSLTASRLWDPNTLIESCQLLSAARGLRLFARLLVT